MKRTSLIIIWMALVASCNTKKTGEEEVKVDSTKLAVKADTAKVITDSHYFWSAELVAKEGLVMKKESPVSKDSLTAGYMIGRLNELYPEVKLVFVKTSNDSIFIKIPKSTYLTQHMGTSGADAYLAEVTYNLTELKDIGFVDIRFKEGDHASPGTYSRTDFVRAKN